MIELIFTYFAIQQDLMNVGQGVSGEFCRRIQLATSMVRSEEIYKAAAARWANNEGRLEHFYAFWENRDTCVPFNAKGTGSRKVTKK